MYKAVIFDLDGVLVEACEWHIVALNMALQEVSNYEISLEHHKTIFNGIPTLKKLEILCTNNLVKREDIKIIFDKKQEFTIQAIKQNGFIRKEKIELLNFLKSKNIKIACYTNSIKETALLMLNITGIFNFFELIVTNQDVKEPKPNPEGYLFCMDALKVKPEECIIVEDSDKGFEAAFASGAKVIRVKEPSDVTIDLLKENFYEKN